MANKNFLSKNIISLIIFLVFILSLYTILLIQPYQINGDTWFHIKAGEIFLKNGIIFHDIFSHSAYGKEWFPYEWFFQVVIFLVVKFFGFLGMKLFVYLVAILQVSIIYLIAKRIFKLNSWLAITISIFYFSWNFLFFQARPILFSNTFFLINLFLLLLFFLKSKNYLFLTIPITWMWTNTHGSIFINIFLFTSYSLIAIANFWVTREKEWRKKSIILIFYTALTLVLTILPPLGLTQYRLLMLFYSKLNLLQSLYDEWIPLFHYSSLFILISILITFILITAFIINKKKGTLIRFIWALPLIVLLFFAFSAVRNLFFTISAGAVLLSWIFSTIDFANIKKINKILFILFLSGFVVLNIAIVYRNLPNTRIYYPEEAVKFIKEYGLNGNMYNQPSFGSYLIYNLYPNYKVFMDLRADVYVCCTLNDFYTLTQIRYSSDTKLKTFLDYFWNKYNISYAILDTKKNTIQERIGKILVKDQNWSLIYWDDTTQLFLKKDGKNNKLLSMFSTTEASPYGNSIFKGNNLEVALKEYERMTKIADSAHSRNAIGYIMLREKKIEQAIDQFEKAIQIDSSFESPYMNLAEISLLNNKPQEAADLYQKALKLNETRAYIYMRLGQIYLTYLNNPIKAREIWVLGKQNIQETTAQNEFNKLIQSSN